MDNHDLVENLITQINTTVPGMGQWLNEGLAEAGPWEYKSTDKAKINCFMRYHLGRVRSDTTQVREYLCDDDDDETWVNSVVNKVVPVLGEYNAF